ncbi:MAG: DUF1844 domain-containing protein [Bdellovibrionota bacterium]
MQELKHSLFDLLVLSLGNATLIALGLVAEPETKLVKKDFQAAEYNIELLEMLKQKTKGNLSTTESEMLSGLIYDLQLKFVEAKKHS